MLDRVNDCCIAKSKVGGKKVGEWMDSAIRVLANYTVCRNLDFFS